MTTTKQDLKTLILDTGTDRRLSITPANDRSSALVSHIRLGRGYSVLMLTREQVEELHEWLSEFLKGGRD